MESGRNARFLLVGEGSKIKAVGSKRNVDQSSGKEVEDWRKG